MLSVKFRFRVNIRVGWGSFRDYLSGITTRKALIHVDNSQNNKHVLIIITSTLAGHRLRGKSSVCV